MKSEMLSQQTPAQVEGKEDVQEPETEIALEKERLPAVSAVVEFGAATEPPNIVLEESPKEKSELVSPKSPAHKPKKSELSKQSKMVVNTGDETGWEKVDRKPRTVTEAPVRLPAESDFVLEKGSERAPSSASVGFPSDAPRAPADTHVIVVSADKDPRKLESMAEATQREAEECDAMRRKAASIPAPWVKAAPSGGQQNGLSLREIQRQEELRSKAQIAQAQSMLHAQREEAARLAAARQASVVSAPWGSAASAKQRTLNLREQMRLEEEQKQRIAKQNAATAAAPAPPSRPARTGGSQVQSGTAWASLVASSKPNVSRQPPTVVGKRMGDEGSFWDTVGSAAGKRTMAAAGSSNANANTRATIARTGGNRQASNTQARATRAVPLQPQQSAQEMQRPARQAAPEPTVVHRRVSAEFAKWCSLQLRALTGNDSEDTTFVEYLVSIKSAPDIRDTVLQNLGSNDASRAFADEFIRRMEFEKSSESADHGVGGSVGRKKGRRQRASKVDPSLVLGFTSTSSSSRIMQGTIEKPTMD